MATCTEAEVAMVEILLKLSQAKTLVAALEVLCAGRPCLDLLVEIENRIYAAEQAALPHITVSAEEEHMRRERDGEPTIKPAEKIAA